MILLIDGHNLIYRTLFAVHYQNKSGNIYDTIDLWKHSLLNSIISNILKFKPKQIIFTIDSENSWRYGVYPLYKADRKFKREKSKIDFKIFFPAMRNFLDELKETFSNIRFLEVDEAEGDDIIGVLSNKIFEKIIIISSDTDLNQLVNDRIIQYDAMNSKYVNSLNVRMKLQIKFLTGDKTDCIPAIKPKVGPKTAEKIIKEGIEEFFLENPSLEENYKRNKTLIDLDNIPENIKERIINSYNNYDISSIKTDKLLKFFVRNKLMKIMKDWNSISDIVRSLI